ncbi:MAG: VTT domain-containing protein [Planctomycetaceae bacterium]
MSVPSPHHSKSPSPDPVGRRWVRYLIVAGLAVVAGVLVANRSSYTVDALIARESEFRTIYARYPVSVLGGAFLLYVVVTALSIPGAVILTLTFGWLFGFWPALGVVSFASAWGATLSCGLSRTLFREAATRRLGARFQVIEESLARDGDFYLLTLRMLPQVPFFLINLAMGLTNYPLWRFYLISQIGMLPATCVFVYTGAQAVDLKTLVEQGPRSLLTPQLVLALCLLAVVPWILRSVIRWIRPGK